MQILVALALVLVGIYIIVRASLQRIRDRQALKWPTTQGAICRSDVVESKETTGEMTTSMYSPCVEYSYEVSGRSYTGDSVFQLEVSSTGKGNAINALQPYPIGAKVEVIITLRNLQNRCWRAQCSRRAR